MYGYLSYKTKSCASPLDKQKTNGLIIQWMFSTFTSTTGSGVITFPTPFSTAGYGLGFIVGGLNAYSYFSKETTTGFTVTYSVSLSGSNNYYYKMVAIGY